MFHCDKCDKDYKTLATLKKHSCKTFAEPRCEYCDKLLSNKFSLNRHFKTCEKKILFEQKEKEEKEEKKEKEEKEEKKEKEDCNEENIQKCITILRNDPTKVNELLNKTSSSSSSSVTNNNITNITNIHNYVTLNISESKLDHIVKEVILDFFKKKDGNFTCDLFKFIHCNPEIPENHNIYISDINRNILKFKENDRWNTLIGPDEVSNKLDKIVDIGEFKVLDILSDLRINSPNDKDIKYFEEQWESLQNNKNKVQFVKDYEKILITELYNNKVNIIKN